MDSCQVLVFLRIDWNLGSLGWLSVLKFLFAWEMMMDFGQKSRSFHSTTSFESGLVKNKQVLEELHFQSYFVIITCQVIVLVREMYLLHTHYGGSFAGLLITIHIQLV